MAMLDAAQHGRLAPTANGRLPPFLAVAGRIVATWTASASAPRVEPIEPLDPVLLDATERAATAATAWLGG